MITSKYICSEINEIIEKNDSLNAKALDDLYKLMSIEHFMCKRDKANDDETDLVSEEIEEEEYEQMDRATAERWVSGMKNSDGTHGGKWTIDQTNSVLEKKGFDVDPIEFYAAMNMMYSDYVNVVRRFNINTADFYACMAEAFLNDSDACDNKLMEYYKHIAK